MVVGQTGTMLKMKEGMKPEQGALRCPKCFSVDVRYGHREWLDEILEWLFSMEVFRCRACRKKFHKVIREE